jgi:hypothetical protein
VIGWRSTSSRPDVRGPLSRLVVSPGGFSFAFLAGCQPSGTQSFTLRHGQRPAEIKTPCLPPLTVPPVGEASNWQAVQVQQVGGIATSVAVDGVATV